MAATLGGHPKGLSLTAVSTAAGFRVAGQKTITIARVPNSASRDPYSSREAKREAHQKARKGHHQFARSRLHPLAPAHGRRPKTLNDSAPSPARDPETGFGISGA